MNGKKARRNRKAAKDMAARTFNAGQASYKDALRHWTRVIKKAKDVEVVALVEYIKEEKRRGEVK